MDIFQLQNKIVYINGTDEDFIITVRTGLEDKKYY